MSLRETLLKLQEFHSIVEASEYFDDDDLIEICNAIDHVQGQIFARDDSSVDALKVWYTERAHVLKQVESSGLRFDTIPVLAHFLSEKQRRARDIVYQTQSCN